MNIADTAQKLVLGDRNDSYGNPREDFQRVAGVWSGLLSSKLKSPITPEEAIIMMMGLKLCREVHKPKDDTRVDIIGYALCLDWATTGHRPDTGEVDEIPASITNVFPDNAAGLHNLPRSKWDPEWPKSVAPEEPVMD